MTLQPLVTPAIWPNWLLFSNAEPGNFRAAVLDAADEYISMVVRVWKTGNIRNVGFLTGTVTSGGANDLDIRIETVDASGNPGGLWGANTNIAHDLQDSDDSVWITTSNLTASAAVTRGDILAVKILNPTTDFANAQFVRMNNSTNMVPYHVDSLGSVVKATYSPILGLQYDDDIWYPIEGCYPVSAENRGLSSTPEEEGAKFQLPAPCKVIGAIVWAEFDNDTSLVIRADGSPGTVLTSKSLDKDHRATSVASGRHIIYFDDEVELSKDTPYRLLVDRGGAATGVHYFSTDSAAVMNAMPGGTDFIRTHGTGAGAFTDVNTDTPIMSLLISEMDDAAGGGGGGGGCYIIGG